MTESEYNKLHQKYDAEQEARQKAISTNRSNRMKRLPPVSVPSLSNYPAIPIAYDSNGNYIGRVTDVTIIQSDWVIKNIPFENIRKGKF